MEERQDRAAIAARSSRDRDAIVERSKRNPLQDRRRFFHEDLQQDQRPIDARSGHDRGRLWSIPAKNKTWPENAGIVAKLKPFGLKFRSYDAAK